MNNDRNIRNEINEPDAFKSAEELERLLDEADAAADNESRRLSHEEVFSGIRGRMNER